MLPTMRGVIDRRILVNYRVEPVALDGALPDPFEPYTVNGYGIGGICLIRLRNLRPWGLPSPVGITSENAAHRIAVERVADGERAVFVPRRDTNSRLNTLLGGRVFPGVHSQASFEVQGSDDRYAITMESDDGETHVHVAGAPTETLPEGSVSLDSAPAVS